MNAVAARSTLPAGNLKDPFTPAFGDLRNWPATAVRWLARGPVVRVLVLDLHGSGPRDAGACMLVGADAVAGTIGGGRLEWDAEKVARDLLGDTCGPPVRVLRLILGREMGQCCGGVVRLWLERFSAVDQVLLQQASRIKREQRTAMIASELCDGKLIRYLWEPGQALKPSHREMMEGAPAPSADRLRFRSVDPGTGSSAGEARLLLLERLNDPSLPLWLFGAGHVGQAIAGFCADLPFRIRWVDSRPHLFPVTLPENVEMLIASDPAEHVMRAPAATRFLVLTHDHRLDYALCRAILSRDDFAFLGLIGSVSKAARFRSRLRRDGVAPSKLARMTCPVGIEGIVSKRPAAIAIAVVAQLLRGTGSALETQASPARSPEADACAPSDCSLCAGGRQQTP